MKNDQELYQPLKKLFNEKRKTLFLCFVMFFLVVFILLTLFVVYFSPHHWDLSVSQEVQEDQNFILDIVMKAFSWLGTVYVASIMVVLFAAVFLIFRYIKEALFIISTLLSGAVSYILKLIIDRPRPTIDFVRIVEDTSYQSFPSGHVLFYTTFFGTLIIIAVFSKVLQWSSKILIALSCITMIFLGATSRIYLGAHWFTDVLGGVIIGILLVALTGSVYLRSKRI